MNKRRLPPFRKDLGELPDNEIHGELFSLSFGRFHTVVASIIFVVFVVAGILVAMTH